MVNLTIIRVILILAIFEGWLIKKLDVNNTFFHGFIFQEIFMDLTKTIGRISIS